VVGHSREMVPPAAIPPSSIDASKPAQRDPGRRPSPGIRVPERAGFEPVLSGQRAAMRRELRRFSERPQEPCIEPRFFDRVVAELPSRHPPAEERIGIRPRPEEYESALARDHCRNTIGGCDDTWLAGVAEHIVCDSRVSRERRSMCVCGRGLTSSRSSLRSRFGCSSSQRSSTALRSGWVARPQSCCGSRSWCYVSAPAGISERTSSRAAVDEAALHRRDLSTRSAPRFRLRRVGTAAKGIAELRKR